MFNYTNNQFGVFASPYNDFSEHIEYVPKLCKISSNLELHIDKKYRINFVLEILINPESML